MDPPRPLQTLPSWNLVGWLVGMRPLKVVTVSCVFGLGTLPSLRLEKKEEDTRGADVTCRVLDSSTCATVTPLSGLMEPSPVWGQQVSVIPTVSQTRASGSRLSSKCNRSTNRQSGRAEAPRAWS